MRCSLKEATITFIFTYSLISSFTIYLLEQTVFISVKKKYIYLFSEGNKTWRYHITHFIQNYCLNFQLWQNLFLALEKFRNVFEYIYFLIQAKKTTCVCVCVCLLVNNQSYFKTSKSEVLEQVNMYVLI